MRFESLYSRLCIVATSRKQVTHRLSIAVFSLILIPQLSRDLNEQFLYMIYMESNCDSLRSSVSHRKRVNYGWRNRRVTWPQTRTVPQLSNVSPLPNYLRCDFTLDEEIKCYLRLVFVQQILLNKNKSLQDSL